jgi:hypothetical protein
MTDFFTTKLIQSQSTLRLCICEVISVQQLKDRISEAAATYPGYVGERTVIDKSQVVCMYVCMYVCHAIDEA